MRIIITGATIAPGLIQCVIVSAMIESERTFLRLPQLDEAALILDFYQENKDHFEPWDPEKPEEFFTEGYWRKRIQDAQDEFLAKQSLRLNVYLKSSGELIGMTNFTNFERGPFHNCRLGYKIGKKFEGQGLLGEALQAAIPYMWTTLKFHRIEANFIPANRRSEALLRRLGFSFHGVAHSYLRINGQWQDHMLSSLVNKTWLSL